jgi:glycosyltransferase involved in cell wall biosynthesis
MRFSVIIPAHNEEALLPRALGALEVAAGRVDGQTEVIVVDNRSTDATPSIAKAFGAAVVTSDARNIALVRNVGAAASDGEVIVTLDADSVIAPSALADIDRLLASGRYVGGGTKVRPERSSPGIVATIALMEAVTFFIRVSGAMFWCYREDFDAVGGFNERLLLAEDIDFAKRLRALGQRTGRKFTTLRTAPLVISTRKFDRFGDWHMFAMAFQLRAIRAAYKGVDPSWVDHYFFDFNG